MAPLVAWTLVLTGWASSSVIGLWLGLDESRGVRRKLARLGCCESNQKRNSRGHAS